MAEKLKISDVANLLGCSQTTIYKKLPKIRDRLAGMMTKDSGVLMFEPSALDVFRSAISTASKDLVPVITNTPDLAPITTRLETIERVMLTMAEGQAALRSRVEQLVGENQALRLRLEAPAPTPSVLFEKPTPILAWSPQPKPDPLAGKPWWAKIWVRVANPEQLRRRAA